MKAVLTRTLVYSCFCAAFLPSITSAQKPELVVQTGHSEGINNIAFSPDGRILASASDDKTIKLWDVSTGHEFRTIVGHVGKVFSVAFGSDGRTLASGSADKTIKLWDVATGRELRTLAGHTESVTSVAFSPNGRILASGSWDRTVKLWDVSTARELRTLVGHTDLVLRVAFSQDGRTLASGGEDNTVKLWDVAMGRELRTLAGHTRWVTSLAFSPDGRMLASGSYDRSIRFWDLDTGHVLRTLVEDSAGVDCVAFLPDGRTLAYTSATWVTLWDMVSGHALRTLSEHAGEIFSLVLSPDGHILASAGADKTINLWDVGMGRKLRTLAGDTDLIHSVAFSPDGRFLASGSEDGGVKLWDLARRRELRNLEGHINRVYAVAFNRDGRTLASASGDSSVQLWDVASGHRVRYLRGHAHTGWVMSVAFSPDGRFLASGSADGAIRLWDVASGRELASLDAHTSNVFSVTFSPDGHTLASAGGDKAIKLWDVASGRELATLGGAHTSNVFSVAFSLDGQILASAGADKAIKLWDVASGRELKTLAGHTERILSVAFSPDGRYLASGSEDKMVKLWDVASGRELASLIALGGWVFVDGEAHESSWAVVNPEGRFDTNNLNEIKSLSWVFPDEPLRALAPEIFMRDYFVPKLLPKVLGKEKLPAVRSLTDLNRTQPQVGVLKIEPEPESDLVSVTVQVSSTQSEGQKDNHGKPLQSGAYDLRLFRDSQLVGQWPEAGTSAESVPGSRETELESWRKLHQINLIDGRYTHTFSHIRLPQRPGLERVGFAAYAFNSDRVKSLTTPPFEYTLPSVRATMTPRRAYLITMGVNANQSHWNLDFAVPSARDAARLLHAKLDRDYEVVDVSLFSTLAPDSPRVLLQQATKANLKGVLDLLAGKAIDSALRDAVDPGHRLQPATPDDAVVVFISSHGYADPQGTFYVVPYDTGASPGVTEEALTRCQAHPEDRGPACQRANAFLEHTISSQEFTTWWAGVDAGEMVMVLDSCHSAAMPGREFRPGPLGDAGFGQLSYDKGMRILTATQPDKTARATLVQELGHSLLVEALQEEAKAHPQETLAEWLHDTEQQVPVLTHRLYLELSEADVQLPELFDFGVTERHRSQ